LIAILFVWNSAGSGGALALSQDKNIAHRQFHIAHCLAGVATFPANQWAMRNL
jgi:hypothetical protein